MAKYRINKAQITVPSASSSGRYRGTGVRLQNIMKDYVITMENSKTSKT